MTELTGIEVEYVDVSTVMDFGASRLGVDPRCGLSIVDWLSLPEQNVLARRRSAGRTAIWRF